MSEHEEVPDGIAVVGLGGRFPGAASIAEFWRNLAGGIESISSLADDELLAAGVPRELLARPDYVKAAPLLGDIESFDAAFFEMSPQDAAVSDPQLRLLLECAWEALEDAGYESQGSAARIGIFAGTRFNSYLLENLLPTFARTGGADPLQVLISNDKDYLPTQISYRLDLRGPSVGVQTACSTGLVTVSLACQSLQLYQCDVALAGAVSVRVPQKRGYFYAEGGIVSPDGHCRAFDASAAGTVFGSGAGVIVLRRLEDALADGDQIYAVILGSAVNNDGSLKVGYTAPGPQGQAEVIALAQAVAAVEPASISYVEAHGTGTALGDPVEIAALEEVFAGVGEPRSCAIGSVKTNIGHLDTAAGMAGLIKTVLALHHRQLPPTLHFVTPNPRTALGRGRFHVVTELAEWQTETPPRRAGVSAFGIGGTNAHVVLEEAPPRVSTPGGEWQLMPLSARSAEALAAMSARLAACLRERPDLNLADVAFTLQVGRRAFPHRRVLTCRTAEQAISALGGGQSPHLLDGLAAQKRRPVAFLLPGQGAQHPEMGRALYQAQPRFRREVDRCCEILLPEIGYDLRGVLQAPPGQLDEARGRLAETEVSQPALFVVEYALARLWEGWGVVPDALAGHSLGELVAACLAGTLELADALRLVAARGRLMQEMPAGAMLAVPLAEAELAARLPAGVVVAAINGPHAAVASGPSEAIEELARSLEADGIEGRRLHSLRAFHSPAVAPLRAAFAEQVRRTPLQAPRIPFLSNSTGRWITPAEATDPGYWVDQMLRPVRFGDNLEELLGDPRRVLLEVGPGRTLTTLARRHPSFTREHLAVASLPPPDESQPELPYLLSALGKLWLAGVRVDWQGLHAGERRCRVSLPTYPWQRVRCWIDPSSREGPGMEALPAARQEQGVRFLVPVWKQSPPPLPCPEGFARESRWLIFADRLGLGRAIADRLTAAGGEVAIVVAGEGFGRLRDGTYTLAPGRREDYLALLGGLAPAADRQVRVLHAWGIDPGFDGLPRDSRERAAAVQERGFWSLLFLAQAIGELGRGESLRLEVLAAGLASVSGDEELAPAKATLLGPARVIPQEYSGVSCRVLDVVPPSGTAGAGGGGLALLAELVLAELAGEPAAPFVAYRAGRRWVRELEAAALGDPEGGRALPRPGGVYLITGGLGGIGLELAEHLATAFQAKLVLTGRSPFPARDAWNDWLRERRPDDPTRQKIERLLGIEARGGEVLAAAADVTDPAAMADLLAAAEARFGPVNGVVHAAGVPGGGLIQLKGRSQAAAVLAPKLAGTLVLADLLAGRPLDFFILCASTLGLVGEIGQVDYCAANAFLDAFAQAPRPLASALTVAIDWDGWSEVGMAARRGPPPAGPRRTLPEPHLEGAGEPVAHPLLGRCHRAKDGGLIFTTELSTARHWLLDEHRIDGRPVLPGTACLEMVRAAHALHTAAATCELRDVLFVSPLVAGEDGTVGAATLLARPLDPSIAFPASGGKGTPGPSLSPAAEGFFWRIASPSAPGAVPAGERTWSEHAQGWIRGLPAAPRRHRLAELLERCPRSIDLARAAPMAGARVSWGAHWNCLRRLQLGTEEGMALLELEEELAGDLSALSLHPALLDVATACGLALLGEGSYLPLSYGRVHVQRPLPRRLYSHFRRRGAERPEGPTGALDVTLLDDEGWELVAIEGFVLRRADALQPRRDEIAAKPRSGLGTADGIAAFDRILARATLPQIVVMAGGHGPGPRTPAGLEAGPSEASRGANPSGTRHPRPLGLPAYVAPRNELERGLAELWEEVLGFAEVGIHDSYFELGGHSVLALQLLLRLRQRFEVVLPLNVLFEAPTVAELAQAIAERLSAEIGEAELDAALDELAGLSEEEIRELVGADGAQSE